MRAVVALVVAGLGLASCVTQEQMNSIYASQRPPSAEIKAAAIAHIRETFFDPYSIRDAAISNVVTVADTGYDAVCVRLNAKNRMGGYVGLSVTSLRIKGGAVVSSLEDAPACMDARLKFAPFPELEAL